MQKPNPLRMIGWQKQLTRSSDAMLASSTLLLEHSEHGSMREQSLFTESQKPWGAIDVLWQCFDSSASRPAT